MGEKIRARVSRNALILSDPLGLPEGSEVGITVSACNGPQSTSPTVAANAAEVLADLVKRMQAHPIPADAPRLTRDAIHELS